MSTTQRRSLKRAAAGVSAGMLTLTGFAAIATPATAQSNFSQTRESGADRYGTAAKIATDTFGTADNVLIASGEAGHFADALAGNFLAGSKGAPVLLTAAKTLPKATSDALASLKAKNVTILGGTSAVSSDVENALKAANYTVTRIGGANRYATGAAVAAAGGTVGQTEGKGATAFLASGLNFADALVAGGPAYAGKLPVEVTDSNTLSPETSASLTNLSIKNVVIVGGTSAVSQKVEDAVKAKNITVTRLAGTTRQATAVAVANYATGTVSGLGFSKALVDLATGADFADALAGGPSAGKDKAALLLAVNANTLGSDTTNYLTANSGTLTGGKIFGGTAAVSDAAVSAAQTAGRTAPASNQTYSVTPNSAQNVDTSAAGQNVSYSVSGLTAGKAVRIQLFNCNNVVKNSNGNTTFANSSNPGGTGNVANTGSVSGANITSVNNATQSATPAIDIVVPSNGAVTFVVSAAQNAVVCATPVVYDNTDGNDLLNLGTDNAPSEAFGVGGNANFFKSAPNGTVTAPATISGPSSTQFTTAAGTYNYGPNDVYQVVTNINCVTTTYADFQRRLSTGDQYTGTYNTPNQSTFCLNDIAPAAPSGLTARAPQGTNAGKAGTEVVFNDSSTATVSSYKIYRATATQPAVTGQTVSCPTLTNAGSTLSPQTPPTSPYSVIGTVTDTTGTTANGASYTFLDTTATVPSTATPTNPAYCYTATSVGGQSGQEGNPATVTAPTPATAATPASTGPKFTSAAAGQSTVVVTYNQNINTATVAANGSDFTVTSTTGGVTTAEPVSAAAANGTNSVTLTVSPALTSGATILVTSKVGTDSNTVCAAASTTNCQAAGDAVQTTAGASTPSVATAPTVVTAAGSSTTAANTVLVNFSQNVCRNAAYAAGDWTVQNTTASAANNPTADNGVLCTTNPNGSSTVALTVPTALIQGNAYTVTLTAQGAPKFQGITGTTATPGAAPSFNAA